MISEQSLKTSQPSTAQFGIALISLVILFVINITWLADNPWFKLPPKPYSDGPDYEAIGWALSQGLGLSSHIGNPEWQAAYLQSDKLLYGDWSAKTGPIVPRTDRPPFLPVVIAAIYAAFGPGPIAFAAVRVFLAFCLSLAGALSIYLAYLLSSQMLCSPRLPKLRPIVYAVGPLFGATVCFVLALFDSNVRRYMEDFLTEMPAFALTQCFVLSVLWSLRSEKKIRGMLCSGMLLGLMIYCRSLFIVWLPGIFVVVVLLSFWSCRAMPTSITKLQAILSSVRDATVLSVAAVVVIMPWCIRNCIVLESFQPLGTKGPITMLGGYCDAAYANGGDWQNGPERYWRAVLEKSFGEDLKTSPKANLQLELELAQIAKREVRAWISSNSSKLPRLVLKRLYTHFNPYDSLTGLVKLMALVGVAASIRHLPIQGLFLVGVVAINATAVAAMYSVGGRFFVPLYGVMYVFCALGCTYVTLQVGRFVMRGGVDDN